MMVKKFQINHLMLIGILLLAAGLRLYRLQDMVGYNFDQEYATNFVLDVVREYPIRYVGQGLSIQGLFMGPWYFYALVPFYLMTGLYPLGGFVASVLLGVIIVYTYYFLGSRLMTKQVGLLAAFLRAISFWAIELDWSMVPSYGSDVAILISWYALYQIYRGQHQYLILLGLVFGLFSSFHLIHLPMILVAAILFIRWKSSFAPTHMLASLVLFVLPSIPLIMFDYWRKWTMTKQILSMFSSGGGDFAVTQLWTDLITNTQFVYGFFTRMLALRGHLEWLGILFLLLILLGLLDQLKKASRRNRQFHVAALSSLMIVFVVYYTVFPAHVIEYYLGAIRAIMLLYLAWSLVGLIKHSRLKWLGGLLMLNLIFVNGQMLLSRWNHQSLSNLSHKNEVVERVVQLVGDEEFAISYITLPGWGSGFDSLFRLYGKQNAGRGPVYTIVNPIELVNQDEIDFQSGGVGLIYPAD